MGHPDCSFHARRNIHLLAYNTARPHLHNPHLKPDVEIKPRAPTDLRGGRVRAKCLVPAAGGCKLTDPDKSLGYSDPTTSDGFELYDWAWSRDGVYSHSDTQAPQSQHQSTKVRRGHWWSVRAMVVKCITSLAEEGGN